jgi:excisionase family DNA binding protein
MTELLTKGEAAKWLGVSVDTLETLMRSGKLPFYRLAGRMIRIHRQDLTAYVESCRVEATGTNNKKPQRAPRICGYIEGEDVV